MSDNQGKSKKKSVKTAVGTASIDPVEVEGNENWTVVSGDDGMTIDRTFKSSGEAKSAATARAAELKEKRKLKGKPETVAKGDELIDRAENRRKKKSSATLGGRKKGPKLKR